MRWLLDEGFPRRVAEWLRGLGDEPLVVAESAYRGYSDQQLWALAGHESRIIITRDRGFLWPSILPLPTGLVVIRTPDNWRAAAIALLISDSMHQVGFDSLVGKITIIEPGRIRQRPLPGVPE